MTLYSTISCPMCKMLATKMDEKGIRYEKVVDEDVLASKNIMHVPILETDDGRMMDLAEAMFYINNLEDSNVR